MRKMWPSGSAFATRALPTVPAAAPWFSETIGWPRSSERAAAWMRALASIPPPGAKGMMRVIGRVGQFCAAAGPARTSDAIQAIRVLFISVVPCEAAADLDGRPGHVAVLRRDEERGDVADLLRLGPAAEECLPGDPGAHLVRGRPAHLRHRLGARAPRLDVGEPRADVVDGDSRRGELGRRDLR